MLSTCEACASFFGDVGLYQKRRCQAIIFDLERAVNFTGFKLAQIYSQARPPAETGLPAARVLTTPGI